jgi:hypothetical protein
MNSFNITLGLPVFACPVLAEPLESFGGGRLARLDGSAEGGPPLDERRWSVAGYPKPD